MAMNAATALEAIMIIKNEGIAVSDNAVYEGLKKVIYRGRLEIVKKLPLVLIDGAHNIQGINALKKVIEANFKGKRIIFIMGMLRDKKYKEAMKLIGEIPKLLITVTVPAERALSAKELALSASLYCNNVLAAAGAKEAAAVALSENPDVILCFGSLYMLDEIKKAFT